MLDDWNDLKLVLAVAREGALTRAATSLQIDHSTVYRRLKAVEQRLGTRLFERSPGGDYCPTPAGAQVAAAAERIEAETQTLDRAVSGRDQRLSGRLKVTSSETLAYRMLTPEIARFRAANPGIQVELAVDNRVLSLSRREADIALRPIRPRENELWGRKIADVAWAIYAAKSLAPTDPADPFGGHPVIGWGEEVNNIGAADWVNRSASSERIVFRSSSLVNQFVAVRAGMGAALLPCYLGDGEPDLQRIGYPLSDLRGEMWIVTHSDLRTTARVRAFFDLVGEGLLAKRAMFEGLTDTITDK
ncbi:LysR family transcriptional regulator [Erythrobacter colymbi]|uniref:LysR family transcriptional regulator n=1 Tax=Erythrobacter colymbi TaxID=1161202 RepID=UPI000A394364|nr:LysR family transcriptional regulator [Erythrobacter colymbi]